MGATVVFQAMDAVFEGMDAYTRYMQALSTKQQELIAKGLTMTWADVAALAEEGNKYHQDLLNKFIAAGAIKK